MRGCSTGAQGKKNLPIFATSAIITTICLVLNVSGASAQVSAGTSGSSQTTAAAAQSLVVPGQSVQLEGELEIIYQDFKDGRHRLSYSLKRSDGTRVPLQFAKEPPTHLRTGERVRANG